MRRGRIAGISHRRSIAEMNHRTMSTISLESLIERLASLRRHLTDTHGEIHSFHRISASQSDLAYSTFMAGHPLTEGQWVATMFAGVGHVREFQASIFVTSCVIRNFIAATEEAHARGDLISVLGQLRALMERFAHLHFITEFVSKRLQKVIGENDTHPFISTFDIDMRTALYGTTVKVNEIARKRLQEIDLKTDLGKGLKEELGVHFAKQVLDKIDTLNRSIPGARAAYEILCDYLHPNVGDLFATTRSYSERTDRFGIKHITRGIGIGRVKSDSRTADRVVLLRIYELIFTLVETCIDDFSRCKDHETRLVELAKTATRQGVKKNKRLFKKNDLCPCSSGEQVFKCCGRGLLWKSWSPSQRKA
jgi:hypothetical protein